MHGTTNIEIMIITIIIIIIIIWRTYEYVRGVILAPLLLMFLNYDERLCTYEEWHFQLRRCCVEYTINNIHYFCIYLSSRLNRSTYCLAEANSLSRVHLQRNKTKHPFYKTPSLNSVLPHPQCTIKRHKVQKANIIFTFSRVVEVKSDFESAYSDTRTKMEMLFLMRCCINV